MNANEIDVRVKQALIRMHVYERDHNRVSFVHTKEMLQMIFELAPIDEKDLMSMMRVSHGIDKRYIRQYLDGFRLWKVIFRENGTIYTEKPMVIETDVTQTEKCTRKEKEGICPDKGIPVTKSLCSSCNKS